MYLCLNKCCNIYKCKAIYIGSFPFAAKESRTALRTAFANSPLTNGLGAFIPNIMIKSPIALKHNFCKNNNLFLVTQLHKGQSSLST